MPSVLLAMLIISIYGLVVFATVNFGISFWRRWTGGTPVATAAADTFLAKRSRNRST